MLIDVLVSKAEARYEIEKMSDRARRLRLCLHRADGLDRDVLKCIEELTEIREDILALHAPTAFSLGRLRLAGTRPEPMDILVVSRIDT